MSSFFIKRTRKSIKRAFKLKKLLMNDSEIVTELFDKTPFSHLEFIEKLNGTIAELKLSMEYRMLK